MLAEKRGVRVVGLVALARGIAAAAVAHRRCRALEPLLLRAARLQGRLGTVRSGRPVSDRPVSKETVGDGVVLVRVALDTAEVRVGEDVVLRLKVLAASGIFCIVPVRECSHGRVDRQQRVLESQQESTMEGWKKRS